MLTIRPSKELLLEQISTYDIFNHYCPNFVKVGVFFKSDLRTRDNNPSSCIAFIKGDLLYTDFGTDEKYRAIDYVSRKYGLSFHDTLEKISNDFGLGLTNTQKKDQAKVIVNSSPKEFKEKTPTLIDIKSQPFTKGNYQYWEQYGWTPYMLNTINVKSISHYFITNVGKDIYDKVSNVSNIQAFSYEYYLHKNIFRRKLYFPNRKNKFLNNGDNTIIQGWDTLPKSGGDVLFITSSLKDIGPFWRLGYYAVAPNSERLFIPDEVFYSKLKKRWKRIIIWYDNDKTGIEDASKFANKYNIEHYYNPIGTPKDPSDFVKEENLEDFNGIIKKIL